MAGDPIFGPFIFQTRQYFDAEADSDVAKGETLTFLDLDQSLLFLSSSIASTGNSFVGLTTASVSLNTINFSKSNGTTFSITVDTGSGQTYLEGPGIDISSNYISASIGAGLRFDNNSKIEATVRTVNGVIPDAVTGNITTALTAVLTGPSASNSPNNLIGSSSGAATGSIANATVWVVSGDTSIPDPDGLAYIFVSQSSDVGGAGKWFPLSTLNQDQADLRYVKLASDITQNITSSLRISGSTTFSGSLFWSGASNLGGATNYVLVLDDNGQIYKTGSYGTGGSGGPGTPSAPLNSIQFNNNSSFGGSANLTFNGTNTVNLTGSLILSGSTPLRVIGTGSVTGSMIISRSIEGTPLTVIGTGSSPILNVVGSTGNLLQTYDKVSGDIFTVGDYPSGLPILRVTSNKETFIGNSSAPGLYNSFITSSVNTGNHVVYQVLTSSYNALWIDYSAYSGSNFRAGTFNTMWSGSTVQYIDSTGSNFGNTNNLTFTSSFSASYLQVSASIVTTNGWTVKGIIRAI
jgi:hypothetical protein